MAGVEGSPSHFKLHEFSAKVPAEGKGCDLKIDGVSLPYLRSFTITADIGSVSRVNVEMLAPNPLTVAGTAAVSIEGEEIHQFYLSLKKIFEPDNQK